MSIFNEFFKKEKPVFTGITRGLGGFGFGGSGGDPVSVSGGTKVIGSSKTFHVFLNPGGSQNFVVQGTSLSNAEVLLIAGGGGGAGGNGSDNHSGVEVVPVVWYVPIP